MKIKINGKGLEIQEPATLIQLVDMLELTNDRYAIEVNSDIVPRSEHENYCLTAGDQVEVVQAIGGG